MTYRGRVRNGVIVLDAPASLPEGAEVEVSPMKTQREASTWADVFKDVIGNAEGLPPDSSIHHDRYLYGEPKK
jgi:hypothetical protein